MDITNDDDQFNLRRFTRWWGKDEVEVHEEEEEVDQELDLNIIRELESDMEEELDDEEGEVEDVIKDMVDRMRKNTTKVRYEDEVNW